MPRKETIVDFDEIFKFAEEKYNIEWNACCDLFHRGHILCNDEGHDVTFELEELELNLKENMEKPSKYFTKQMERGYPIIIDFMKINNLTEMRVLNDF